MNIFISTKSFTILSTIVYYFRFKQLKLHSLVQNANYILQTVNFFCTTNGRDLLSLFGRGIASVCKFLQVHVECRNKADAVKAIKKYLQQVLVRVTSVNKAQAVKVGYFFDVRWYLWWILMMCWFKICRTFWDVPHKVKSCFAHDYFNIWLAILMKHLLFCALKLVFGSGRMGLF